MKIFLTVMVLLSLGFSAPANAANTVGVGAQVGCQAIDSVLRLIPGAFKTIMLYEGFRFHIHRSGLKISVKPEVKCNTRDLFGTLEKTLDMVCSTVDAFSGGASNPAAAAIGSKLASIKSNLSAINGAENRIKNKGQLKDYLDSKMVGIDNDTSAIANLGPKANTNPTTARRGEGGWIHLRDRKSCRTKNRDSDKPPSDKERAADNAAEALANAKAAVLNAEEDLRDAVAALRNAQTIYESAVARLERYRQGNRGGCVPAPRTSCVNQARDSVRQTRILRDRAQDVVDDAQRVLDRANAREARAQRTFDDARVAFEEEVRNARR